MARKNETCEIRSFYCIGIIVPDAWKAFEFFETYFKADRSKLQVDDLGNGKPYKDYRFKEEKCDYPALYLIFPLGGIDIELIQPLNDEGPYAEFLREHGPGIQHMNITVDDNVKFARIMQDMGATLLCDGRINTCLFQYYDAREQLGMVLETCQFIEPMDPAESIGKKIEKKDE